MLTLGAVIIGRNEGERLVRCIDSLRNKISKIIYVDSGSTDHSVENAKKLEVDVIRLDMSQPFTAARARNCGFEALINAFPEVEFVQFVDGDCEVLDGWLENALKYLRVNPIVAVVNGVLNERFPEKSIYNYLCDIEWKTSLGEIKACGGNALIRVDAFKEVNGFMSSLVAGEEPELCVRLRSKGWKIWHLGHNMMLHDANIMHFSQWWKRSVRAGYAFAEGASIHGAAPELHWVAESRRATIWAAIIPLLIVFCFLIKPVFGLVLLLVYPLQILRTTFKSSLPIKKAFLYSVFLVMGKFPEQVGQFKFLWNQLRKKRSQLIEYK